MNERISLLGITVDRLDMSGAVERVLDWVRQGGVCRYVVTPNVDHMVLLHEHPDFQQAYRDAGLVLADGWPVVWAARILGRPLPQRVAGSDLVPALLDAISGQSPLRVFLLGAAPGVADKAATNIHRRWPAVQVVGTYSPPLGFQHDPVENQNILMRIQRAAPHVLLVGLGAPKQELWVHTHRRRIAAPVALCVGATIDFLSGEKRRAPAWMRHAGLEWLHRLLSEPRRLVRRYARDACIFPRLVLRQRLSARL